MTLHLPLHKNFGDDIKKLSPSLNNQLSQMYTDIALSLQNVIKKDIVSGADPAADTTATTQRNTLFSIGDITIRTDTNAAWIMTSRTAPNVVTWTLIT